MVKHRPMGFKFALLTILCAVATPAFAAEPTIEELLNATDDVNRGESSQSTIEMQVKTKRYERSMTMKAWSRGEEDSLIRILSPAKDAGTTTLKVGDDMWNYIPKIDRTMKIPPGMMSGSWMGSHFSNDDLVKSNRLADEFDYKKESFVDGVYTIVCTAKADAAVVWGKVIVKVRADKIPVEVAYYDEDGELARKMTFSDVKDFDGRKVPATMLLVPADRPDEFTRITTTELDFDVQFDARTFSLQALKE
ncbi:MAG: outer membrane lipoprotein-sorting protein [Deltaproteobacteria bacterium]|nr:outer membrane lipoprotein-sorting protein [Deltaproteobacteria bacterium]